MIDTDKYEGHLASEGQTWAWSKWMLKNAETTEQHTATATLLNDAPLILQALIEERAEVERMRKWIRNQRVSLLLQVDDLEREVERLREAIKVATTDLEEPNMHEETRKDLLDMLKELIE